MIATFLVSNHGILMTSTTSCVLFRFVDASSLKLWYRRAKYLRQTLLFSSHVTPEINALFSLCQSKICVLLLKTLGAHMFLKTWLGNVAQSKLWVVLLASWHAKYLRYAISVATLLCTAYAYVIGPYAGIFTYSVFQRIRSRRCEI